MASTKEKRNPGKKEPSPEGVVPRFLLIVFSCLLVISVVAVAVFHHKQVQMMDRVIRDQGNGILSN
ncbi:MAG TPA: hypothetical protein VKA04_00190, partial [Pseudodesulfovibrio sp.]|nr:hypothetical protein [Pseudodesulfovibrio sp.]